MLEVHEAHEPEMPACGVVVVEHVREREEKVVQVRVGESGLRGECRRKMDVAAVKAVVDAVLASHRAVVVILLRGFRFAGDGTPGDRGVNGQNFVEAFGERELQGAANLPVETSDRKSVV